MFFRFLKSKLGITKLEETLLTLEQKSVIELTLLQSLKQDFLIKLESISTELSSMHTDLLLTNKKLKSELAIFDQGTNGRLDSLATEVKDKTKEIEELLMSLEKQNAGYLAFELQKILEIKQNVTENFLVLTKLNKEIKSELAITNNLIKQNNKKEKPTKSLPSKLVDLLLDQKETRHDSTVLDKNYLNALLKNEISGCYNSSEIRHLPNNYTILNHSFKQVGSGMQNRHCYDNALLFGNERGEVVYIGVIFPKEALSKVFHNVSDEKITLVPFLHAWNLSNGTEIADYTLGKRSSEFLYVGRPLSLYKELSAKGLEEILRKETL